MWGPGCFLSFWAGVLDGESPRLEPDGFLWPFVSRTMENTNSSTYLVKIKLGSSQAAVVFGAS